MLLSLQRKADVTYVTWTFLPDIPVPDGYDMSMSVGHASNTLKQFRHLEPLSFMVFEEKKLIFS